MPGFDINLDGLDATIQLLDDFGTKAVTKVGEAINTYVSNVAAEAIAAAPADEGILRNSIKAEYGNLTGTVEVGVDYGAYLEFGTRGFAQEYVSTLPADWQEFAGQHRGSTGESFEEFVAAILRWVKAKGIGATYDVATKRRVRIGKQSAATTDEATAYAIAIHIARNGIRAQPFLYPAVQNNYPTLIATIKEITGAQ